MRETILPLLAKYLPSFAPRPSSGGNVLTKCPFHKGGQETKPSFSVNIDVGIFHCFTCHVAGPIGYMLKLLGLPRSQIDAEIAPIKPALDANREAKEFEKQHFFTNKDPFRTSYPLPESLLGVYEWCPTSLLEAGFSMETLQDFEVGFDRLNARITYPLRDMYGTLAGISGGKTLPNQVPKYLVYQGGHYDAMNRWKQGDFGPWFDEQFPSFRCENHDFIWNYHRVYPRALAAASEADSTVILCEGFKACMWMVQCGFYNTVALMGSYISDAQQRMLHRLGGTVVLFFDNDDAGREATKRIGRLLWRPLHGRLKVMQYPEEDVKASVVEEMNSQPDDYEAHGLAHLYAHSLDYHVYMQHVR